MCHIHGFVPYFYVPAPAGFNSSMCAEFQSVLQVSMRLVLKLISVTLEIC
jgi:hypothetical protein